MAKITLSLEVMQLMTMFENMTGAKLKDCIIRGKSAYFIVQENEIGKAIGKRGSNVKRLERIIKRPIHIIEFHEKIADFIKGMVYPAEIKEVQMQGDKVIITPQDLKSRGLIIGKNAENLRFFEQTTQRYFPISEIRVK